jgi:HemY protein
MIKIFFLLASLIGLIYIFSWLNTYTGSVLFLLGDYEVTVSPLFFTVIILSIIVLSILSWLVFSYVISLPKKIHQLKEAKIRERLQNAISSGLIYAAAGNANAADLEIKKIDKLAKNKDENNEIMTLLLKAQNASLKKDNKELNKIFQSMKAIENTKMLSYRGLYTISKNAEDPTKSIELLKEAEAYNANEPWLMDELLKCYLMTQNWKSASDVLEKKLNNKLITKKEFNTFNSIVLTAHALSVEEVNQNDALNSALEAIKLEKSQIISALICAKILSEQGDKTKAEKIILDTWKIAQHEDLAYLYSYLQSGISPKQRIERIEALIKKTRVSGIEGAVALSRAFLDDQNFDKAREIIEPHVNEDSSKRIFELLGDIEAKVSRGGVKSRDWIRKALNAKIDTGWHDSDISSSVWIPCLPATGEIKVLKWGDYKIKSIDDNAAFIENFDTKRLLAKNIQEIEISDTSDEIEDIEEVEVLSDNKQDKPKDEKKDTKTTKTAPKKDVSDDMILPDDPGVTQEEDINEP